jgi:hypothetical protein
VSERTCPVCGAEFIPERERQTYCTTRCTSMASVRKHRGLPIHDALQRPPGQSPKYGVGRRA